MHHDRKIERKTFLETVIEERKNVGSKKMAKGVSTRMSMKVKQVRKGLVKI